MQLTGERTGFQESLTSIHSKRKQAMSAYKKLKKEATSEQVKFGKRLIQSRAREQGTTIAVQERQLRNAFGQRKLAQRVKRLIGKQRGAPLRSVTAPHETETEQRIECNDKTSIEQAFIGKGTRRFSQTNGGPLMRPEFVDRVGYLAELPGADKILDGTFIPAPDMDPYAVKFLAHLKMEAVA
jgi:hypothetical protein